MLKLPGDFPFLSNLPPRAFRSVTRRSRPRRFEAGRELIEQGRVSDRLYLIVAGRVRVERRHPQFLLPVVLAELGAGATIGELGLLDGSPQPFTAVAAADTEALELDAAVLRKHLQAAALPPACTAALTWDSPAAYAARCAGSIKKAETAGRR